MLKWFISFKSSIQRKEKREHDQRDPKLSEQLWHGSCLWGAGGFGRNTGRSNRANSVSKLKMKQAKFKASPKNQNTNTKMKSL